MRTMKRQLRARERFTSWEALKKALALELDLSVYRRSASARLLDSRGIKRTSREIAVKKLAPKKIHSNKLKSGATQIENKKADEDQDRHGY